MRKLLLLSFIIGMVGCGSGDKDYHAKEIKKYNDSLSWAVSGINESFDTQRMRDCAKRYIDSIAYYKEASQRMWAVLHGLYYPPMPLLFEYSNSPSSQLAAHDTLVYIITIDSVKEDKKFGDGRWRFVSETLSNEDHFSNGRTIDTVFTNKRIYYK